MLDGLLHNIDRRVSACIKRIFVKARDVIFCKRCSYMGLELCSWCFGGLQLNLR